MKSRKLAGVIAKAIDRVCRYGMEELEKRTLLTVLPTGFTETTVASNLTSPTALVTTPDGRVFFSDQTGHIRVIQNNQLIATPLADLSSEINSDGERGLLGITLDPQFATNHFIYLYYTAKSPTLHNRVARITENPAVPNTMLTGSEKVLFDLPDIPNNNNILMGGSIQFSGDGKLLVAVGDQNDATTSQSLTSDFGKILRINSDGTIPTDNPFYNQTTGVFRAIWNLGLRNPFTTAVQPGTGKFFVDDVGQEGFEEIDDGTTGGQNFGWATTEGTFNQASFPNFTEPFLSYAHGTLGTAITGGSFYNPANNQFPAQYVGKYFFNDFVSGTMYTIDTTTKAVATFETGIAFPEGITVGSDGSMYYLARGTTAGGQPGTGTGSVLKIQFVANTAPSVAQDPASTLVSVGQTATFTVSASGTSPLAFQWQKNNVDIPNATSSTYTTPATALTDNNAVFRCHVTNAFGNVFSKGATLSVTSVPPPTPIILTPINGANYHDGDTITFSGMATDQLDGTEPASRLTWRVDFQHETHAHPFIPNTSGISGGTFTIPNTGETDPVQWYRIYLTATDSLGLTTTTFTEIFPLEANLTLGTNVPGAQFTLDGQTGTLPETIKGVTRELREVNIPLIQLINGQYYEFTGWSDGGAQDHTIPFPDSDGALTANLVPVSQTFVSSLGFLGTPTNGDGPVELNTSNGEGGPGDGHTITLNGVTYAKGLGAHAASDIKFNLNGAYDVFTSDVGIDDEEGSLGTVDFQVFGDGVKLFDSGVVNGTSPTQTVDVSVKGVKTLELVVTNGGDNINNDHADWAGAAVYKSTVPTAPIAPSGLMFTVVSSTQINLNWTDTSSDETGFKVERSIDGTNFTPLTPTLPANTVTFSDTGLTPGKQYWYEIVATNSAFGLDSTPSNKVTATTFLTNPTSTIVSTLPFVGTPTNGWGPVELNTSNGENAAGDGKTMTLNGKTYAKGLGAHANSDIKYNLGGAYTTFTSDIGIDDEVTSSVGSVIFQVVGDGKTLYTSPVMKATSTTLSISVGVVGVQVLDLVVTDAGDGNSFDHADWAGATLLSPATVIPPNAPSALTPSNITTNSITLNWTDNAAGVESGFKIEDSTDGGVTYTQIGTTATGITTFTAINLTPNKQYSFRVRATSLSNGDSTYSNVAPATTLPIIPPNAPSALTPSNITTNSITLNWTDNAVGVESGFKIEDSTDGGVTFNQIGTTATGITTFNAINLTANKAYSFRVRATSLSNGDSTYSNVAPATTLPIIPPNAPSALTPSNPTTSSITLNWTDNAVGVESGFKIEDSTDAGVTFNQIGTTATGITTFTAINLAANKAYSFRVRATSLNNGDSDYSNIAPATTLPIIPPNAPSALTPSNPTTSSITLNWTDNAVGVESGFKIEDSTDGGATFSQIGTTAPGVTTFTAINLTANKAYFFRVRATSLNNGDSDYSNIAPATTLPIIPPNAPTTLTPSNITTNSVTLNWTDNAVGVESGFKVEDSTDGGATFNQIGTTATGVTAFTAINLTPNKAYSFRVRATSLNNGDSDYSNIAPAMTLVPTGSFTYVSALPFVGTPTNGWGPVELNTSNGENAAGDGGTITLNGITYSKGIGAHGNSDITYVLGGNYSVFSSDIGIDDEVTSTLGTVIFKVVGDGVTLYTSPVMTATSATQNVQVNVAGVQTLDLIVTDAGDGNSFDHADWAGAALTPVGGTALPAAPTNLVATAGATGVINLTWAANTANVTGFRLERSLDGVNFIAITPVLAPTATSFSDTGLASGTKYFYRIRAAGQGIGGGGDSAYTALANATTSSPIGTTLPVVWSHGDVGTVGKAGSVTYNNGVFSVLGAGPDISGNADAFQYVYQSLNGDGTIIARVVSENGTDSAAKAGVMIRETLTAGSKEAMIDLTPNNQIQFRRRLTAGATTTVTTANVAAGMWYVRLVRSGSTLTASYSSNGQTWTTVGSATVSMVPNIFIGLAVTSHISATLMTAKFDNVILSGGVQAQSLAAMAKPLFSSTPVSTVASSVLV